MRILALVLLASPLIASAGPVNLIKNGSFEANAIANNSWSNHNSLSSWTAGNLGVELRNGVEGKAKDGSHFVELDTTGNSWISQSFGTLAGQTYTLSFSYANRPDTKEAATYGLRWSVLDSKNKSFNSGDVAGSIFAGWETKTVTFTAQDVSTTLKFEALGKNDSYGYSLDNVSVSAVPEPSTYALMLVGLGAMGFAARRRAQRQSV